MLKNKIRKWYKNALQWYKNKITGIDTNLDQATGQKQEPDWVKIGLCSGGVCAAITALIILLNKKH